MLPLFKKHCHAGEGTLALDVGSAKIPGVVRLDLASIPVSYFHVISSAEGSVLGYSDAHGKFTPIAVYADRAAADKALAALRCKLLNPCPAGTWVLRLLAIGLAAIILMIFINWIGSLLQSAPHNAPAEVSQSAPARPAAGVPMDADNRFNQ